MTELGVFYTVSGVPHFSKFNDDHSIQYPSEILDGDGFVERNEILVVARLGDDIHSLASIMLTKPAETHIDEILINGTFNSRFKEIYALAREELWRMHH